MGLSFPSLIQKNQRWIRSPAHRSVSKKHKTIIAFSREKRVSCSHSFFSLLLPLKLSPLPSSKRTNILRWEKRKSIATEFIFFPSLVTDRRNERDGRWWWIVEIKRTEAEEESGSRNERWIHHKQQQQQYLATR